MDEFLKTFSDKYEEWRKTGIFTYSSKIIPVRESFTAKQWVIPAQQVLQILADAHSFALTDCLCRDHYARCNKPRDVCILIDDLADKAVGRGKARRISLADASHVLAKADKHGLVHMALYMPGHTIYALCSCCSCCCHELQLLKQYSQHDLVARSDFEAVTDMSRCTGCGLCIGRCLFAARSLCEDQLAIDAGACLGCGLCVSACPEHAITMQQR